MSLCGTDIEYKLFLRYGKKLYLLPCVAHIRQLFFKLGTWGKKDTQVLNIVRTYVLCLLMPFRTKRQLKDSKLVQSNAVRTFQVLRHLIQETLDNSYNICRGQRAGLGNSSCQCIDIDFFSVLSRRLILRIRFSVERFCLFVTEYII